MSRGKYAARAANRLVQTDNELLREKCAEVERLKQELQAANQALTNERNNRGAMAIARADELSRDAIAAVEQKMADEDAEHRQANEWVAECLTNFLQGLAELHQDKGFYPRDLADVLTRLVGSEKAGGLACRVLETYDPKFGTRVHRRTTAKDLKSRMADAKRPDWAKGVSGRGYLEPGQ